MLFLDIFIDLAFIALGAIVIRLAMTHRAPDGRLSKFLGIYKLVRPPVGFIIGALLIALGVFSIVQSIRFQLGYISR